MKISQTEHDWFSNQLATYLANGLDDAEKARFESHAAQCESCARELDESRYLESQMGGLFGADRPDAEFEDRVVNRLRMRLMPRRWVHPVVKKAAIAAAIGLVVGGLGYAGQEFLRSGAPLPRLASDGWSLGRGIVAVQNGVPASLAPAEVDYDGPLLKRLPVSTPTDAESTLILDSRESRERFDRDTARQYNAAEGKKDAYTDNLRFPESRPELTSNGIVKYGGGVLTLNGDHALQKTRTDSKLAGGITITNGIDESGSSAFYFGNDTPASSPNLAFRRKGTIEDLGIVSGGTNTINTPGLAGERARRQAQSDKKELADLSADATAGDASGPRAYGVVSGTTGLGINRGTEVRNGPAANGTWTFNGGGDWSKPANWVDSDAAANSTLSISGAFNRPTVKVTGATNSLGTNGPVVLGGVKFDDVNQAGAGGFTTDYATHVAGTTAGGPAFKPGDYGVRAVDFGTFTGTTVNANNAGLTKSGGGTLILNGGSLTSGKMAVAEQSSFGTGAVPNMGIAGGASFSGNVQITGGALVIDKAGAFDLGRPNVTLAQVTPGQSPVATTQPIAQAPAPAAPVNLRRVIREGTMEFEVDNFDSAFAVVSKITMEEGGFVVAADSDKLPNGKVRGAITVRVPPDNLDTLVLKLRALGELKTQRLGSRDVGKEYTDLEGELKAARAMEERLLEMIKTAQGNVAQLLQAERELGTWRTKIEKIVGQLTYYNNLISMATLTINAYEKDIRTAASATQTEEINAGVETEDVETARASALKSIEDAKGRIIESTLQKLEAGQFAAKIIAEVPPENSGQIVDRLRQLGRIARLDSQRKQTTQGQGTSAVGVTPKIETLPTRIVVSMYNLANVAPRLTTNLNLTETEVEPIYRAILARVTEAGGRIVTSNLNRQDATQAVGNIQFEVKADQADAVRNDITRGVQVLRMTVNENPDTANVTTAKQAFVVQIVPLSQVAPRLTTNLNLAGADVEASYRAVLKRVTEAGGRVLASNLNRQNATQAVGSIQFELKADQADVVRNDITRGVQVLQMTVNENPDTANTTTAKQVFVVQIIPTSQVAPREVRSLSVETSQVEQAVAALNNAINSAGGRALDSTLTQDANGQTIARLSAEVPLDKLDGLADAARQQGKVRTSESSRNTQVPEGPLAKARLNLTIGTGESIVPAESGFWHSIREGLSTSVRGLAWSLQLIVIGLCLVGPWVALLWGGWKMARRKKAITPAQST